VRGRKGKTNQQDRKPRLVCKTSIRGFESHPRLQFSGFGMCELRVTVFPVYPACTSCLGSLGGYHGIEAPGTSQVGSQLFLP